MAIKKNITVVLTLDDAGFSPKVKAAKESVSQIQSALTSFSAVAEGMESAVGALSANVGKLGKSFDSIQESIKSSVKKIDSATASGFGAMEKTLKMSIDKMQATTTAGFAKMNKTQADSVTVAKNSATATIDSRLRVLKSEQDTSKKMIADRERLYVQLKAIENDYNAKALSQSIVAENIRRQKKAGSGREALTEQNVANGLGGSARVVNLEAEAIRRLLVSQRAETEARTANIIKAEKERLAIIASVEARLKSAAASKQAALEEIEMTRRATDALNARLTGDRASENSARMASRARITAAREAALEERKQAEMVAQMWKSIGQMYVGSKIGAGLKASVKDADEYARALERVDAAGIGGAEGRQRTLSVAKQVELANPNISKTDSLKLTSSAVAGTMSTDTKMLGTIVPEIAKLMTVMTRQFPEQAHNLEDFGRNIMGVMEARGVTQDTGKMMSTLDNLARAMILTQGKMSVQDYETISRRGGAGNSQLKSDESILYEIAAASQLKVMGGGGGGAGGVSTFATMEKQMSKRAQGGVIEKRSAMENQIEFGMIDKKELMNANGNNPLTRNFKSVPYIGAEAASENITKYTMDMVNSIKKKLAALPESDTRFFAKGVDRTDDMQQAKALGRFADTSVGNTNAAEFMKMFATKGSQERVDLEVQGAKDAPTYGTSHEVAMKSWGVATDITKASLEKLGVVVGDTLIPVLKPMLSLLTTIVDGMKSFGEDNPFVTKILAVSAGFLGVQLTLKGLMGMYGNVSASMVAAAAAAGTNTVSNIALAESNTVVATATLAELSATFRSTEAHLLHAQMQLRDAEAAVANAAGMTRLRLVTETLIPAQTRAALATEAHAMSQAALGVSMVASSEATVVATAAQRAMAGATRMASGALALVGGPLGLITIALMVGISCWDSFGNAADQAAKKAKKSGEDAADAMLSSLQRMEDELEVKKHGAGAVERRNAQSNIDAMKAEVAAKRAAKAEMIALSKKPANGDGASMAPGFDGQTSEMTPGYTAGVDKEIAAIDKKIKDQTAIMSAVQIMRDNNDRADHLAKKEAEDKARAAGKILGVKPRGPQPNAADDGGEALDTDPSDVFKKPGVPRERVDRLTAAIELAKGQLESEKIKLKSLVKDAQTLGTLKAEVVAELEGKRKAGEFNKDRDVKNPVAATDKRYLAYQEDMVQKKLVGEEIKAVTFANERLAASTLEADTAMERITSGNAEKTTDAFRALSRELVRAEQRLGAGATAFGVWGQKRDAALAKQAEADLFNNAAGYIDKSKTDKAGLIDNDQDRQRAQLKAVADTEDAKYRVLADNADRTHARQVMNAVRSEETEAQFGERIAAINADYNAKKNAADALYSERRSIRAELDARAMETPLEKMVRSWQQTTTAVESIQANAANGFVSMLTAGLTTGHLQFKSFLASILQEILASKIKATLAAEMTGSASGGMMGTALKFLGGLATSFLGGSAGGVTSTLAGDIAGGVSAGVAPAASANVSGLDWMSAVTPHAMGGVTSQYGEMTLRKYAKGGIANSPQIALYGEAGPEAYVPLPDGRSIPVTLSGASGGEAGGSSVVINIAVTGGANGAPAAESKSSSGGDANVWAGMAAKIKGVVQEELMTQQRPGGSLYR